jgi:hypothetical protein
MTPSTPEVKCAPTDGAQVAFRLEWEDTTKSDAPGPSKWSTPARSDSREDRKTCLNRRWVRKASRLVTYWRADWQATIDGRGDTIAISTRTRRSITTV